MTFNINKRPLAFDADYERASQVPRLTWSLPKCCSVEEGEAISHALELLNTQSRDHPELLLRIKINILKCSSAEEIYAEIASLAYLAKNHFEPFANLPFFIDILKIQIEERLERITSMHSEACGPRLMEIPSGGMHYLLTLFSQLLITDDLGISRMGIACIRRLLVHSKIPFYFEPQHYKHINLVLDQFERNPNFLSAPINVHENLHKYCRIDLKFPEDKELNVLNFKRWVVQMFLTDIIQSEVERNCCAISALKFSIANGLKELLDVLLSLLSSGYFYPNWQVRFDIATLMEGQSIRSEDLSVSIENMLFLPPVLEEIVRTHHLNRSESDLTVRSLLGNNPYLQRVYCSYRRNLLQIMILNCSQLLSVNSAEVPFKHDLIEILVSTFLPTEELKGVYGYLLYMQFSKFTWLWDANPDIVIHGPDTLFLDGFRYRYEESNLERLQTLFRPARRILVVDARGITVVIDQFRELLAYLEGMIPSHWREEIFFNRSHEELCEILKQRFTSLVSIQNFAPQDFGDFCCLSQLGGDPKSALDALGQSFVKQAVFSGISWIEYLEKAKEIASQLPSHSSLIFKPDGHAFVTDAGGLQALVCEARPPKERLSLEKLPRKAIDQPLFEGGFIKSKISGTLKRLGFDFDSQACKAITRIWANDENNTLASWAIAIRDALILARLGVFQIEKIESALRVECGCPDMYYVADLNWSDQLSARHCILQLNEDGLVENMSASGTYRSALNFSNGYIYHP